jgi:hypothetical protein
MQHHRIIGVLPALAAMALVACSVKEAPNNAAVTDSRLRPIFPRPPAGPAERETSSGAHSSQRGAGRNRTDE